MMQRSRPLQSSYKAARSRSVAASAPASDRQAGPQHFTPPTARELRAQAVQRLQVGLFGLAAMLLLVGLASIIMQHARQSETGQIESGASDPGAAAARSASAASGDSDPLADIGVAPSPGPAPGHRPH